MTSLTAYQPETRIEPVTAVVQPGVYRMGTRYVHVGPAYRALFATAYATGRLVAYQTDGRTSTVITASIGAEC